MTHHRLINGTTGFPNGIQERSTRLYFHLLLSQGLTKLHKIKSFIEVYYKLFKVTRVGTQLSELIYIGYY